MNLDVRRVWECPACGRQVKRHGDVTGNRCACQDPPVWMHLKEESAPHREYRPYIVPELDADELAEDEEMRPADLAETEPTREVIEVISPPDEIESPAAEPARQDEESEIPDAGAELAPEEPDPPPSEAAAMEDTTSPADPPSEKASEKPSGKDRSRRRRSRKRSRRGSQGKDN